MGSAGREKSSNRIQVDLVQGEKKITYTVTVLAIQFNSCSVLTIVTREEKTRQQEVELRMAGNGNIATTTK